MNSELETLKIENAELRAELVTLRKIADAHAADAMCARGERDEVRAENKAIKTEYDNLIEGRAGGHYIAEVIKERDGFRKEVEALTEKLAVATGKVIIKDHAKLLENLRILELEQEVERLKSKDSSWHDQCVEMATENAKLIQEVESLRKKLNEDSK